MGKKKSKKKDSEILNETKMLKDCLCRILDFVTVLIPKLANFEKVRTKNSYIIINDF